MPERVAGTAPRRRTRPLRRAGHKRRTVARSIRSQTNLITRRTGIPLDANTKSQGLNACAAAICALSLSVIWRALVRRAAWAFWSLTGSLSFLQAAGFASDWLLGNKDLSANAASSLFFALSSVLTKYTFDHSNFISGMVWTRIGFILPVPFILIFKKNREAIFQAPKEAGVKKDFFYSSVS